MGTEKKYLYIADISELQKELFRMGNSGSPKLTKLREGRDIVTQLRGDFTYVLSGPKKGVSAFDHITKNMKDDAKRVWRITNTKSLPTGLVLIADRDPNKRPGHYMIAPEMDMPLAKYIGLLEELAAQPGRCKKLTAEEINHA